MDWKEIEPGGGYSRIAGMDPSADWLLGPGLADFTRGADEVLIPFIIAPLDGAASRTLNEIIDRDLNSGDKARIIVPDLYRRTQPGDYICALAPRQFFEALAESSDPLLKDLRRASKQIRLGLPLKDRSLLDQRVFKDWQKLPDPPVWRPDCGWPEGTVIVGVIDDGIAFAHERFRTAEGETRVQLAWRQDGRYAGAATSTVPFGQEICKLDHASSPGIDSLLASCARDGLVDEDRLYREAGLIDFRDPDHKSAAWRLAHGTHVLDLAAGCDSRDAPADRPIIAVQLPVATTADTSGATLEFYVKIAIDYILDRAGRLGAAESAPLPVVINFSYGMTAGPHDGTSALEQAIDAAVADRGGKLSFVLPAGNGHLSRCHAEIEFCELPTVSLPWRVQPDDLTSSQMEIWLPPQGTAAPPIGQSRVSLRVEAPSGALLSGLLSPPLEEQHGAALQLVDAGEVVAEARYFFLGAPTNRGVFLVTLQPTQRLRPTEPAALAHRIAPSGLWKVHLTRDRLPASQKLQAWIQRDDVIYGYPRRGRQSYFDAGCYTRFHPVTGRVVEDDHEDDPSIPPCPVKRRGLLNAIATGCRTIVIGGLYREELEAARYSAGGPTATTCTGSAPRDGPDALAPSDDSRTLAGVVAAGSRSGSAVAMAGTSVAAPQIARLVATLMADPAQAGDRAAIRLHAGTEEASKPQWPQKPREIRAGEGRIPETSGRRPPRIA